MNSPLVSVVIPTYGGADHLGEAMESVLCQSYEHFELIVVNDVSPDCTYEVVARYRDRRVRYITHEENRGAVAARYTGVKASQGERIFFLDQDDQFHPEKLAKHMAFLVDRPEIGVTYNSRFEVEEETRLYRTVWQAPVAVSLADLVLGFPFSPSDTVLRRDLALMEEIWDQSYVLDGDEMIFNGAEIVMGGRLALGGFEFANVGKALNYRRYHPRRKYRNIAGRCAAELKCQAMIFNDARCPQEVRDLRHVAFKNTNLIWAYYAFSQDETDLGQDLLREAIRLDPSLSIGDPSGIVRFMVTTTAADGSVDLEMHLERIFSQLPKELMRFSAQLSRETAQGYLNKGTQTIIWNRVQDGRHLLEKAAALDADADSRFIQNTTYELLGFQQEFGVAATEQVAGNLANALKDVGIRNIGRRLLGSLSMNQGFRSYEIGAFAPARRQLLQAIAYDPSYLLNRGVWTTLIRSVNDNRREQKLVSV